MGCAYKNNFQHIGSLFTRKQEKQTTAPKHQCQVYTHQHTKHLQTRAHLCMRADTARWTKPISGVCHGWQWSQAALSLRPDENIWDVHSKFTLKIPLSRCHSPWLIPSLSLWLYSKTHLHTHIRTHTHTHTHTCSRGRISEQPQRNPLYFLHIPLYCTWRRSRMPEPF